MKKKKKYKLDSLINKIQNDLSRFVLQFSLCEKYYLSYFLYFYYYNLVRISKSIFFSDFEREII